jgi:hypothetical protein
LDEDPAIAVRQLDPAPYHASQDDQLMSQRRILRLSRLFDLNGEAKMARTKQSVIIAPA